MEISWSNEGNTCCCCDRRRYCCAWNYRNSEQWNHCLSLIFLPRPVVKLITTSGMATANASRRTRNSAARIFHRWFLIMRKTDTIAIEEQTKKKRITMMMEVPKERWVIDWVLQWSDWCVEVIGLLPEQRLKQPGFPAWDGRIADSMDEREKKTLTLW